MDIAQQESLGTFFFAVHEYGVMAWQLFFALHLFFLGYLVVKTKYAPQWLGYLMLIGSFGYGLDALIQFLWIDSGVIGGINIGLLAMATIGEITFAFWLLIKGINTEE